MPQLVWNDAVKLGNDVVDHDHEEAFAAINAMIAALDTDPTAVAGLFDAFLVHTREHFGREESLMTRYGFPAYPVHKGEHQRVLAELDRVAASIAAEGPAAADRFIRESLPGWLIQHLHTMDAATVGYIRHVAGGA